MFFCQKDGTLYLVLVYITDKLIICVLSVSSIALVDYVDRRLRDASEYNLFVASLGHHFVMQRDASAS